MINSFISRRSALKLCGMGIAEGVMRDLSLSFPNQKKMHTRPIPSSGENLPIVGLGTYKTFDVDHDKTQRANLTQVLKEVYNLGGRMIDSSPMYASSETVIGDLTSKLDFQDQLFYATKVWTSGKDAGIQQMNRSAQLMQREQLDLIQIHNLQDWRTHVKTLKSWKESGEIKYWGITHYVDFAHVNLESVIKAEKPDFVQFNYSITSRNAEKSLFDTARNNGVATIINMPFNSGALFRKVSGKSLPTWAKDYEIDSWGQYFLKFILSNEGVNCVIPGTSKPHHAIDNMNAGYGILPDHAGREKMYEYLKNL